MASEVNQQLISGFSESQKQQMNTLRTWINTQVEFRGRSDDEFLAMYLHGCKYDLEKAKKKIVKLYEVRKRVPQWFANRDINDPYQRLLLQLRVTTVLIDKDPLQPTVLITKFSRIQPYASHFDDILKTQTMLTEILIRRRNTQLNGIIWLMDCTDYPLSLIKTFLSPITLYNFISAFYLTLPLKLSSVHVLNSPFFAQTTFTFLKPFFTPKIRKRIHFYKADWSQMLERTPLELLPDEYGGLAGPLTVHEESFEKEFNTYSEYFLNENKYGFVNCDK